MIKRHKEKKQGLKIGIYIAAMATWYCEQFNITVLYIYQLNDHLKYILTQ